MTDWANCPAVESIPGKVSGNWVFTDSRLPVYALFENLAGGATIEEFMDWFHPVDECKVKAVLQYVADSLRESIPVNRENEANPESDTGAVQGETEAERRRRLLREVFASFDAPVNPSGAFGNLTRDEVHDRKRARAEAAVEAWLAEQERERR